MAVAQLAEIFLGNRVLEFDVECGHAARGAGLRVGRDALLVRQGLRAPPLDFVVKNE